VCHEISRLFSADKSQQIKIGLCRPTFIVHLHWALNNATPTKNEPIVHKYVGTLDVTMQEVVLMTEVQSFHQLTHQRTDMSSSKRHQTRLKQTHQIMIHVLKDQIK